MGRGQFHKAQKKCLKIFSHFQLLNGPRAVVDTDLVPVLLKVKDKISETPQTS